MVSKDSKKSAVLGVKKKTQNGGARNTTKNLKTTVHLFIKTTPHTSFFF